ncbi:MAG: hypothetical protein ACLT33_05045 [Lachnospira pectinoschiza]
MVYILSRYVECKEHKLRWILIKNEIFDWKVYERKLLSSSQRYSEILKKNDCSEYFYSSYDECIEAIKARGNE